jgi:small subunit ribosomal protein S9
MATAAVSVKRFYGTGRRKSSVARLYLTPGEGQILVNKRDVEHYFGRETLRMLIQQPVEATGNTGKFNITVNVKGGGLSGQAGAVRHGIARALLILNPDYRKPLNKGGFLTRDSRKVEPKKYGHRKARKKSQYSKR